MFGFFRIRLVMLVRDTAATAEHDCADDADDDYENGAGIYSHVDAVFLSGLRQAGLYAKADKDPPVYVNRFSITSMRR